MCKGLLELEREAYEEGYEEGLEEGLEMFVRCLKKFVTDKTELCKNVRRNKVFEKYSDEEILKYY